MDNNGTNIKRVKELRLESNSLPRVTEVDEIFDITIPVSANTKSEIHESPEKIEDMDKKESRLNPDIDVITKKDPDETIILPNDELKKWNNRNRNQPL